MQVCKLILSATFFISSVAYSQPILSTADSFYFKGDFVKAIPLYKTYLSDTSTNPLLWQRLAFSTFQTGDFKMSLGYYKKAFSLNPPGGLKYVMYSNILKLYDTLNMGKEALDFMNSQTGNGFGNFVLFENLSMFNSLKNSEKYKEVLNKIRLNAYPCLSDPKRNEMAFWVGEWDVYQNGSNSIVGKSSITKEDGGCVIIEHFTSLISPQSGHSINFYDPADAAWKQLYSGSSGGNQLYTNGIYKDSAMIFDYETKINGKTGQGHYILYNEGREQFRQYQDVSFDGGKTVQVNYDFIYRRKK